MFSPPLYDVRKITLKDLSDANFDLQGDMKRFMIKQSDSPLLRQIRLISGSQSKYNKYIVFVDCHGGKSHPEVMEKIVFDGFKFGNQKFKLSLRSASMTRNSILSFVDDMIWDEVNQRIDMDIPWGNVTISKVEAYRGLMLSSCHCIENWVPKIVVVPDMMTTIKNQHIKYAYDNETEYIGKDGQKLLWKQKDIAEKYTDIEINAFDGCGIHHPAISRKIEELIGSKTPISSFIVRLPYIKGCSHEVDYVKYFRSVNITEISDIWGVKHSVTADAEPIMIITESMYKGYKYFKNTGTVADWKHYWDMFRKYNHCFGIAKWNFTIDEEPAYTRANYQILQDLNLPYEKFALLAKDSIHWIEKIINGDPLYTYCFLGLKADKCKPLNNYRKAILKNPEMLKEYGVRQYLLNLIDKYKDDLKCGKIWLKGSFKFLVPDLMMLMQHIRGLPTTGCLESDEFYSFNKFGIIEGEKLIERNPHICKSEHTILKGVNKPLINEYFGHLTNTCMINCKSITPQRLNGADQLSRSEVVGMQLCERREP